MPTARTLVPQELIKTSQELAQWMSEELPSASLTTVAHEITILTQEAVARAEKIRQPNLWLRAGVISILVIIVAALGWQVYAQSWTELLHFADITKGVGIYLLSALVFLVTLEIRLKRRNALKAVHELRAMAHIIDMHQLAKDPVIESFRDNQPDELRNKINQYLHACTALLALVSKIGQLYVENFPDSVAVRAVDDFESMATGLSNKIWSKILSLGVSEAGLGYPQAAGAAGPAKTPS
jgi:4-amino-4-deoxy-L-arabinose transferase-like glycosyltransferase